jgi:hypothetical protein
MTAPSWKVGRTGERSNAWKGGTSMRDGYRFIHKPDHPNAQVNGYVAEHILIALEAVGRDRLEPWELVHHIDGDRSNNQRENLAIAPNRSTHNLWHKQLEQLALRVVRGERIERIVFTLEKGYRPWT